MKKKVLNLSTYSSAEGASRFLEYLASKQTFMASTFKGEFPSPLAPSTAFPSLPFSLVQLNKQITGEKV